MNVAQKMKTTSFQISDELLKELKMIARKEGRSVSSQVRIFLDESVTRKNTDSLSIPDKKVV